MRRRSYYCLTAILYLARAGPLSARGDTLQSVPLVRDLSNEGLIQFIQFILRRYWGICVVMLLVR